MTTEKLTAGHNLTSLQTFLLSEEAKHPHATGAYTMVLSALSLASKFIAARCRRAGLEDVLGSMNSENVQGENQQKLDVIANEALIRALGSRPGVAVIASEEDEEPIVLSRDTSGDRPYVVLFDPLDGSSNLDVCGGIGTIFSILQHDRRTSRVEDSALQPGVRQVGAGYVLYGPSTVFVLTTGKGVQMFVLDPAIGSFLLVNDDVRIPESNKMYSMNSANLGECDEAYRDYVDWANGEGYSMRYVGTMVADVHRTLMKGGVFLYPPTKKSPKGKLRLMYEANPMAMLIEQAGGKAYSGTQRTMEIQPDAVHQRVPVILGSPNEVDHVLRFVSK
ncbi:Fructose-1,6-bisphosphatase class 1 [Planctomycetes bacterium Poly30]|uniref:Fructose-1,6-bisphosphatase class 1 n=1 Tax=Saltatorellus ferox TaxID=2528018 RepID=A0A518EZ44_9BACT|nr:Fructose-1,6-bisphosphatase class 1 [Planctomycetes bacterium Poly30]